MLRVVFAGYRDWALRIIEVIQKHSKIDCVDIVTSNQDFQQKQAYWLDGNIDVIVFLGWSWIIEDNVIDSVLCIGIHPSDLPEFRGGSPIQNQIMRGIIDTNISLITLAKKLDSGDIWCKTPVSFEGNNIEIIFTHIAESAIVALNYFFDNYPCIVTEKQEISKGSYYPRRKPTESRLRIADFKSKSARELYDFIRCLTTPYPNAFFEDEQGNRVYFESVRYEEASV